MQEEEGPGQSPSVSPAVKANGSLLVRRGVAEAGPPLCAGRDGRGGVGRARWWAAQTTGKAPLERATESPCLCALPGAWSHAEGRPPAPVE